MRYRPAGRLAAHGRRRVRHALTRLGAIAAAGLVGIAASGAMVLWAPPAAAHARLKSIDPAHKSVQTTMPTEVVLTFSEPPNRRYTEIRVTGPGGAVVGSGAPEVRDDRAILKLRPLPEAGRYTVAYRTVSVDGHPISGEREFTYRPAEGESATLTAGPTAAVSPIPTPSAGADQPGLAPRDAADEQGGSPWVIVALLVVAAALVTGAAVTIRRGRRDS